MIRDLTQKEIRFCDEYLISFNGSDAAIKAGYSKKTSASIASEMLKKPKIQNYLSVKKKKKLEELEISQERTLKEIGRIAFADIRQLYNEDGTLKPVHELTDDIAATISSVKQEELFETVDKEKVQVGVVKEVKQWSKPAALEMLAKHFDIYSDAPVNNTTVKFGYGKEEAV